MPAGQFFNTAFLFSRIGYLCAPKAPGHAQDLPGGTFPGGDKATGESQLKTYNSR